MLRTFDFLGALKWPSLLAVTLLPIASYVIDWRYYHLPSGPMTYSPIAAGPPSLHLTHPGTAQPARGRPTRWCAHAGEAAVIGLAYGDADVPTAWKQPERNGPAYCVTLEAPAPHRIWVKLAGPAGAITRSWPLDGATRGW